MSGHGDYNRGDCFAPPVIRRTNDGDLQDAGVGCDNRLDFDRVDTFAATLDQIILAVDDIDIATCVAAAQITTIEPAIAYRRCGFRRPRPVTRGYLGSADYDFPDTIRHNIDAVVIDDPQVDHLNRFPRRSVAPGRLLVAIGTAPLGGEDRRKTRALDHRIHVRQHWPERFAAAVDQRQGRRRAAVNEMAKR